MGCIEVSFGVRCNKTLLGIDKSWYRYDKDKLEEKILEGVEHSLKWIACDEMEVWIWSLNEVLMSYEKHVDG